MFSCAALLALVGCNVADDAGNSGRNNANGANNNNGMFCLDANPSEAGCAQDTDCAAGQVCAVAEGCRPSICTCDSATGQWSCTADCGELRECKAAPSACAGPDPSVDGCSQDADCAAGEECAPTDTRACRPSTCSCGDNGQWACSEDCGQYNACRPKQAGCTTPDPSKNGCEADSDCGPNERCAPTGDASCVPSSCGCDEVSGTWSCTDDCGAPMACVAKSACADPDPSAQGCDDDASCAAGEVCGVVDVDACVPSSCFCDEATGSWTCSRDCGPRRGCTPPPTCAGPNPSIPACGSDLDCGRGEACAPTRGCRPSGCSCDAATGNWLCTKDCATVFACQAPTCAGPDPSVPECVTNRDCGLGGSCVLTRGCRPSACSCDAATGQWDCTADCQSLYVCR
jgi:hypothetical protein